MILQAMQEHTYGSWRNLHTVG